MALGRKTGGRKPGTPNKATAALRKYAQQFDTEAIDGLVALARNAATDDKARVMAWKEVLDRAHGKPPVAIGEVDNDGRVVPSAVTLVIRKADSGKR